VSQTGKRIDDVKQLQKRGRCLHFDAGKRCNQFIAAHSIQKQHLLNYISEDGHVYRLNADYSTLQKNEGNCQVTKIGVNKASTFMGFCKKHDNELFREIDRSPLLPNDEQVFLYAFRSICREVFVKENTVIAYKSWSQGPHLHSNMKEFLSLVHSGAEFGLRCLLKHKQIFDDSLKKRAFYNIRYVAFMSPQKPTIFFSGQLYPDFDFLGNHIQDLGDHNTFLELMTFFSAPTIDGWTFVFAWHESSKHICDHYMRSLATFISEHKSLSDALFGYVFLCCENHAISPSWWEGLTDINRAKILEKLEFMVHPVAQMPHLYLREGLEGITDWNFTRVVSTMED
jgi:hypothetical protein